MFTPYKKWIGKTIGGYSIIERLGEGRYGITFLATTLEKKLVVIKKFKPFIFKRNKEKNAYEAVILSQIQHPSIPNLLGVINEPNFYGFVLEHMPGATVESLLFKQNGSFNQLEIYQIGKQPLEIMKYLHEKGIVHRDIRIPNVLLYNNTVSLLDFGLARWVDGDRYTYEQDFSYLADFLLYLHYSSFQKQGSKNKPWYVELDLNIEQIYVYKRMLGLETPYQAIDELDTDFIRAFSIFEQIT